MEGFLLGKSNARKKKKVICRSLFEVEGPYLVIPQSTPQETKITWVFRVNNQLLCRSHLTFEECVYHKSRYQNKENLRKQQQCRKICYLHGMRMHSNGMLEERIGTRGMAQWVKVFAAKPDGLSSFLWSLVVERTDMHTHKHKISK